MDLNPQIKENGKDQGENSKNDANSIISVNFLDELKQKRHRRSKNDSNGRDFKCPECGKCYLSSPALTNHRKTKHEYGKDGEKKGRGRPRKEVSIAL